MRKIDTASETWGVVSGHIEAELTRIRDALETAPADAVSGLQGEAWALRHLHGLAETRDGIAPAQDYNYGLQKP